MSEQQKNTLSILVLVIVGVLVIASVIIWAVSQQEENTIAASSSDTSENPGISHVETHNSEQTEIQNIPAEKYVSKPTEAKAVEPDKQTKPLTGEQRRNMELIPESDVPAGATLAEIINQRKTWSPVLTQWFGQDAPDFALKDLDGKEHQLSSYKGKDVLVIFWATWCPPCKMEIPHLKLMEQRISKDDLKILAVTSENTGTVEAFVSSMGINYTVLLDRGSMPNLYRAIPANGIPSAVFINPQGKIKLITVGYVSYDETRAILNAKK
jgi:peroxiredoxin